MKRLFIIFIAGLFIAIAAYGNNIPLKGRWGGKSIRSLTSTPEPPTVSINGNVLSFYFTDALSDITVTVTDDNGTVMYQSILSGGTNSTSFIPLNVNQGNYLLTMEHLMYGSLSGEFVVQ